MDGNNILMTEIYKIGDSERVLIIKYWLGRDGFHFTQMLTIEEREKCQNSNDLFKEKIYAVIQKIKSKPNKDKCHFRCTRVLFFREIISGHVVWPDPWALHAFAEIPLPRSKKVFFRCYERHEQVFPGHWWNNQANEEIDISEYWLDMEQYVPGIIWQGKGYHKERYWYEFLL